MGLRFINILGLRLIHDVSQSILTPTFNTTNLTSIRKISKHWDPKFKRLRRLKVIKVDLPDFQRKPENMTDEDLREEMKKLNLTPQRPWIEKTPFLHSTGGIFEPYVPPEGDGKVSPISKQGAMQSLTFLTKKSRTMMAVRKIRQFEEDFDAPKFCIEANDIYKKMHELLTERDKENLIDYVTERAYPEVIHNTEKKTIHWKYLKDIELPRIVQARTTDIITKENIFAQLTVRFHTQQILAIYDRFGRLIHGSEILAKDVLEYVVFEKHIANEYGSWRIHAKIIPDWLPPREPSKRTFIYQPQSPTELGEQSTDASENTKIEKINSDTSTVSPVL